MSQRGVNSPQIFGLSELITLMEEKVGTVG